MLNPKHLILIVEEQFPDDTPSVIEPGATFIQPDGTILTQPDGTELTQQSPPGLPNPPAAPLANPATNVTNNSFQLNWDPVAGTNGYRVDVYEGGIGEVPITVNHDVGNTVLYDTGPILAGDTSYSYRVRAYNTGGTSPNSNTIIQSTDPDP